MKNAVPSGANSTQGSLARSNGPPVHLVTLGGIVDTQVRPASPLMAPALPRAPPPSDQRSCWNPITTLHRVGSTASHDSTSALRNGRPTCRRGRSRVQSANGLRPLAATRGPSCTSADEGAIEAPAASPSPTTIERSVAMRMPASPARRHSAGAGAGSSSAGHGLSRGPDRHPGSAPRNARACPGRESDRASPARPGSW